MSSQVVISIIISLIVNPNKEKVISSSFFLLFLSTPFIFFQPWERLNSTIKKYTRAFVSLIFGNIVVQSIIFIMIVSKGQINYYFFKKLMIIITIIIYAKFSETYASKALENGGPLWKYVNK